MYDRWLEHLSRRGNFVVYPQYQRSGITPLARVQKNVSLAISDAVARLRHDTREQADIKQMALVGHSLGGALAVDVAALAPSARLPEPVVVMAVQPGRGEDARESLPEIPLDTIPAKTLMLVVTGEDDTVAGSKEAERIFVAARTIPPSNKNLVLIRSDRQGTPPLVADHWSPLAASDAFRKRIQRNARISYRDPITLFARRADRTANALHYFGYWKLCDALIDAAFHGRSRRVALGDTPEQRFMGRWSDGVPVRELLVQTQLRQRFHLTTQQPGEVHDESTETERRA
jgi:pimeloyl-ACP methyl ester carboxylesterase